MSFVDPDFALDAPEDPPEDVVRRIALRLSARRIERGSAAWMQCFRVSGPATISFSGGRTSGYLLHEILSAHNGRLPDDVHVVFTNTGREMPATLDFVRDCGEYWGVPIVWAEYRRDPDTGRVWTEVVTYETASRAGEPFRAMLDGKGYLPNPTMRICTMELKISTAKWFAQGLGWKRWKNHVGLRADEPRRVAKIAFRNARGKEPFRVVSRLARAGVRKDVHVLPFWREQPFDLQLAGAWEGNCDCCFLKSLAAQIRMAQDHPELTAAWAADEARARIKRTISPDAALYRKDRPRYARILDIARENPRLPGLDAPPPPSRACGGTLDGECGM